MLLRLSTVLGFSALILSLDSLSSLSASFDILAYFNVAYSVLAFINSKMISKAIIAFGSKSGCFV